MDKKDRLKIVTAYVFGTPFYGSTVWLSKLTKSRHWRIINSIHYRAFGLAIGDYRNKLTRLTIDHISKRFNLYKWMSYSNAKKAINLINLEQEGPRLSKTLRKQCYVNQRRPKIATVMEMSRLKVGHNAFQNRLQCMKKVNFEWLGGISVHSLRINLKKTFIKDHSF